MTYDPQVDSPCAVCGGRHPAHQAYLLKDPLMVYDPILKVEVYNPNPVFICPNFEHVNAIFSPIFTRWDPLLFRETYASKRYWEFINGRTDFGNLPYKEYFTVYEQFSGTFTRVEVPFSGGTPLQAALPAQLKRLAKGAAKAEEADARDKDFSKYCQPKKSSVDRGSSIKHNHGHGFLGMPMFMGTTETPEAPVVITQILSKQELSEHIVY